MQQHIDTFTQAQADFSAKYDRLQQLNKEQEKQEKIFKALQAEISEIQTQQGTDENAGQFLKLHQKSNELSNRIAGIKEFIATLEYKHQLLILELAESKPQLINAYSLLMEAKGNQALETIAENTLKPLRNAFYTITQSTAFTEKLRNFENITRKNIDPIDFLMKSFINLLLEKGIKTGEQDDQKTQEYTLNFKELDEIPDISPIKIKQARQALTQGKD